MARRLQQPATKQGAQTRYQRHECKGVAGGHGDKICIEKMSGSRWAPIASRRLPEPPSLNKVRPSHQKKRNPGQSEALRFSAAAYHRAAHRSTSKAGCETAAVDLRAERHLGAAFRGAQSARLLPLDGTVADGGVHPVATILEVAGRYPEAPPLLPTRAADDRARPCARAGGDRIEDATFTRQQPLPDLESLRHDFSADES
jgi:hypothetical protein